MEEQIKQVEKLTAAVRQLNEELAVLSDVTKDFNGSLSNTAMLVENLEDGLQTVLVTVNGLSGYVDDLYVKLDVISKVAG